MVRPGSSFLKYRSDSAKECASHRCGEGVWLVEGGATRVELLVTASLRILSASFQCTVSTNFETARIRSELIEWVVV